MGAPEAKCCAQDQPEDLKSSIVPVQEILVEDNGQYMSAVDSMRNLEMNGQASTPSESSARAKGEEMMSRLKVGDRIDTRGVTIMRQEEDMESEIVRRFAPATTMEVLEFGKGATRRRIKVDCVEWEKTGWISLVGADGLPLIVLPGEEAKADPDEPELDIHGWDIHAGPSGHRDHTGQRATAAYQVGDMIETIAVVFMREEEDLDSQIIRKFPHGSTLQIQQIGTGPTGRRVYVESVEWEKSGWVSVEGSDGLELVRKEGATEDVQQTVEPVDQTLSASGEPLTNGKKKPQVHGQLRFDFEFEGRVRSVSFTSAPLGMNFKVHDRLKVTWVKPGSHAKELGVEPGWSIRRLDGEDVDGKDFEYVVGKLRIFAQPFNSRQDVPPFGIDFQTASGDIRSLVFTRAPIGFTFILSEQLLVDIVDPGSHASTLGVSPGWELKRVVGCDMTGLSWHDVVKTIKSLTEQLPSAPRTKALTNSTSAR